MNIRDMVDASMAKAENWGMDTTGLAHWVNDDGSRDDMTQWDDKEWVERLGEEEGLPSITSAMDDNLKRLENYK